MAQVVAERNARPLEEFDGLSPAQMQSLLYAPFDSPEVVRFADSVEDAPVTPMTWLFHRLAQALGDKGGRATAMGFLPRTLCRDLLREYLDTFPDPDSVLQVVSVRSETDFLPLHMVRVIAELARLVRRYKGRWVLTRRGREVHGQPGRALCLLLRTCLEQFNWAYADHCDAMPLIQGAAAFSLYLLARHGQEWRSEAFYADAFLRAFPMAIEEVAGPLFGTPEEYFRRVYAWRTLQRFAAFAGLVEREPGAELLGLGRVRALPLLHTVVEFH